MTGASGRRPERSRTRSPSADFVSLHVPADRGEPPPDRSRNRSPGCAARRSSSTLARGAARRRWTPQPRRWTPARSAGVALDVTEAEPLPAEHALRTHPRALVTPHMAFYSVEAQAELQRRAADEVLRALAGEPPDRPVNPEVLPRSERRPASRGRSPPTPTSPAGSPWSLGARRGSARATCRVLAANGVKVAVAARSQERDRRASSTRSARRGGEAIGSAADVGDLDDDRPRCATGSRRELGPIDILLPFAGGFGVVHADRGDLARRVARR